MLLAAKGGCGRNVGDIFSRIGVIKRTKDFFNLSKHTSASYSEEWPVIWKVHRHFFPGLLPSLPFDYSNHPKLDHYWKENFSTRKDPISEKFLHKFQITENYHLPFYFVLFSLSYPTQPLFCWIQSIMMDDTIQSGKFVMLMLFIPQHYKCLLYFAFRERENNETIK